MPDAPGTPGQGGATAPVQPVAQPQQVQPEPTQQQRNPDGTYAPQQPAPQPQPDPSQGLVDKYIPQGVDPAAQQVARQALEAARAEWDPQVTRRIQAVHEQYKDPNALYQWLQEDPKGAIDWVVEQYKGAGRDLTQEFDWASQATGVQAIDQQNPGQQPQQQAPPPTLTSEQIQQMVQQGVQQGFSQLTDAQQREAQAAKANQVMDQLAQQRGMTLTEGLRQDVARVASTSIEALRAQGYDGDQLMQLALQAGVTNVAQQLGIGAPAAPAPTVPGQQPVTQPAPGSQDPRIAANGQTPGGEQPQPLRTDEERQAFGLQMLKAIQSQQ